MVKEIPLPDNHKRALSSSLYLVEKLLEEMEGLILEQNDSCCSEILNDTFSKKLKGYGSFPQKFANEYDTDIAMLIEITNRINY